MKEDYTPGRRRKVRCARCKRVGRRCFCTVCCHRSERDGTEASAARFQEMPPGNAAQVSISGFLGNVHNNSGLSALLGVYTKQNLMHGPQTITQLIINEGNHLRRSSALHFVATRKLAPACREHTSLRRRFQVAGREPRFLRRVIQCGAELPLRCANSQWNQLAGDWRRF